MMLWRGLNMTTTEDEFLKALALLEPLVQPKVEYRFYYDDQGNITQCSMIDHQPNDTQYVVVDKETYSNYQKYTIKDGKPKMIDRDPGYRVKLKSSTQGYAVVKGHAGILLENKLWTDVEYYDNN